MSEGTSLKTILEAALLAAGRPLELDALAAVFDESAQPDHAALRTDLAELEQDYAGRGIEVREVGSGWRIQVRASYAPWVSRLWEEKACGEAARNYIGVNFFAAWSDESPGIKLVRQIAQKYNRTEIGLTSLYINGIGVSMLFGEAFKRAGKDLTPDSLKAALETFKDYNTGGVFPPATYTSNSHAPSEMVKFFKADVANKRLVAISDWRKPKQMK